MKTFLLSLLLFSGIIINAQSDPYQKIFVPYSGAIDQSKNVLTKTMEAKLFKHFKLIKPADYILSANLVGGKNVAQLESKKNKTALAIVIYDETETIMETDFYKPFISLAIVNKIKAKAIAKGLSKTEVFDLFKYSNSTGTWYEIVGTIDGAFGFMYFNENLVFLSKMGEDNGH